MRVAGRKDVREEAAFLERLGFRYQGTDSAGHHVFDHPEHGEVVMASSPSSFHWRQHHRRAVAKAMGLNVPKVEALIHGQPVTGKRSKRAGRKRSRPAVSRHLHVAPVTVAAPPVPEPAVAYSPTDPWTREREKRAKELQKANLGERARERLEHPWPWPRRREAA